MFEAVEDYKQKNAANDVSLLSEDPSLAWVMLAIAGAAVDVAALNTVFKSAGLIAKSSKEFNKSKDLTLLKQQLEKIQGLDVRIKENITRRAKILKQEEAILKSMAPVGRMYATIPGLHQTGDLLARAYFAVRKGILTVDNFVVELRVEKLIKETNLTKGELQLVEKAFSKAQLLSKDERLAAEISKAVEFGDIKKFEELIKTDTAVLKTEKTLGHEYEQARSVGDYLGGGEFEFIDFKQGVEGFLKQGQSEIPISLKEFTSQSVENIFRKIRANSKRIIEEAASDSKIIVGANPNTVLFSDILNFDKKTVLHFIAISSENILPSKQVFKQVVFRTNDGSIFSIPLQ